MGSFDARAGDKARSIASLLLRFCCEPAQRRAGSPADLPGVGREESAKGL